MLETTEFDAQPTLVGATVTLSPLRDEDWDALFAVASDRLIWEVHPAHDRWQEPVFRRFFANAMGSGGGLIIRDNASGAVIGSSRYDRTRVEPGEVEIGWTFLARAYWGGTTNREVKALMIGHALRWFDAVVFYVGAENVRSRRAMEKIGGTLLPDRTIDFDMAGVPTSHVVYAIRQPLA
ncbi:MAG: GNAT family N-acetyltransferase [Sphingomonas sp.]|uniref:GNAT family N-acetyltransferase n=1 Tax=Sphingomonas sp. TaxID=28214 RepID=UPI0025D557B8|nr:GNAT family N-acetyltransferase [Sphingomonas sp.]MBY0282780.1 GNAT family N-acetyltransferase [Sphingomonas sp.]